MNSVEKILKDEIAREYGEYEILRQDVGDECARVMWDHYYGPQITFIQSILDGSTSPTQAVLKRWLTLEVLPLEE